MARPTRRRPPGPEAEHAVIPASPPRRGRPRARQAVQVTAVPADERLDVAGFAHTLAQLILRHGMPSQRVIGSPDAAPRSGSASPETPEPRTSSRTDSHDKHPPHDGRMLRP
jgi:hypothetical protein